MLKTPDFWTKRNIISYALWPLSLVYFLGFSLVRFFSNPQKVSKPVICVGNLIAGGSGKTPLAIALGKILHEIGIDFAYLSRGYMNDGSKFLQLRKDDGKKASQVGDEPLLLCQIAPTFVAKNRLFGARQIEAMNRFKAILLDDGMQNNSLQRDYNIMVVDGKVAFGNEFMIPAGPMRESLGSGLNKVDLVVIIGEASSQLLEKISGKKIISAKIIPLNLHEFNSKKLLAFCGLAYPHKFFDFLESQGLEVVEKQNFADHYFYSTSELEKLYKTAQEKNLTLITTKKDWVKFPKFFQEKISFLDIELELENKELVKNELKKFL